MEQYDVEIGKFYHFCRVKVPDGLDQSDGANGNQILLIRRLGVVFLEQSMLLEKFFGS